MEEALLTTTPEESVEQIEKQSWGTSVLDPYYWEILKECLWHETDLLKILTASTDNEHDEVESKFYEFALQCMMKFVQANFTGPDLPQTFDEFFNSDIFQGVNFKQLLSFHSAELNVNTKFPGLLVAARTVFKICAIHPGWNEGWYLKSIIIHQHVLDELVPQLLSEVDSIEKKLEHFEDLDDDQKTLIEIDLAQAYSLFRNIPKIRTHLEKAQQLLGFSHKLVGREGKRTKYQSNDLAQLIVQLELTRVLDKDVVSCENLDIPKNLELEDDVRLNDIKFKDGDEDIPLITTTEQHLLLAIIQEMRISRPVDELHTEELLAYISTLVKQKNTWAVRVAVLLLRCGLEKAGSRTIQRCLLQCEQIIEAIKKDTPHPLKRVDDVYASSLPPIWKIEAQLAELYFITDCIKSSLDIYLKLQHWEKVIACYICLNLRHKAEEIIRQQLEIKKTVKLLCLLGDVTNDVKYYEEAWELSNKRSALVQRRWGLYYFDRKQYKESIPYLKESLTLNHIQPTVWFQYGFAAIQIEDWTVASIAFKRYTTLDPNNFQAWNNLANAYIKLGNKLAAHRTLHEATKCEYNQWKVWDNLMVVSVDIAHFSDVILAYHQILDLKGKHLDVEVLAALVYGVSNNVPDFNGNPAERLMGKTRELLGRISSMYPTNGHVWELYSSLAPNPLLRAQRLHNSLRGFKVDGWEKDAEKFKQVLYVCQKLSHIVLSEQIQPTDNIFNSVRLTVQSVLVIAKGEDIEETRELVGYVSLMFAKVLEKLRRYLEANQSRV